MKEQIKTDKAPAAIGTYSQAIKTGNLVFISGQIPLDPTTMEVVDGGIEGEITQAFANLRAVAEAAGGDLNKIVKVNVYLIDLAHFGLVNAEMTKLFSEPFPARAAIQAAALPKGVQVEVEAVMAV
ncbi:MAG: Rid family detoxifying hydrolase [Gammaproteobacteria bacterium]|nr:Rid family detoxifying hydrolase [Gammaproteobacteria bacterium]